MGAWVKQVGQGLEVKGWGKGLAGGALVKT